MNQTAAAVVGVTGYKVYRGGSLIAAVNAPATGCGQIGLAAATAYSYTVAACDAAANCSEQSAPASATTPAAGAAGFTPSLATSFNLLGNSFAATLNVAAIFGSQTSPVPGITESIDAIWSWNAATRKWKFLSPQLTGAQNAAYAAANGFEVLAAMPAGEGYWVNSYQPFALQPQSGTPFDFGAASFGLRPRQWNLLATASTLTVQQFTAAVAPAGFESLWQWDATRSKWYFYSPELESGLPFTNAQYCLANNCLDFGGGTLPAPARMLGLGAGFWVYRP